MAKVSVHDRLPTLSEDEQEVLDRRRDEIAEYIGAAANNIDAQRIHAIDIRIRNTHTVMLMWDEIVKDEITDGTLKNLDTALEEVTLLLSTLRQRVDDVRQTRQHLLDSEIPECKDLHAIVERGFPSLEAYLETVTHIREIIARIQEDPAVASMRTDSEVYKRLSDAIELSKTQFDELAKIGLEIQGNAAYLGYRKYLDNNKLEAQRQEPVNREMLSEGQAA